jgi:hypothetical protein
MHEWQISNLLKINTLDLKPQLSQKSGTKLRNYICLGRKIEKNSGFR